MISVWLWPAAFAIGLILGLFGAGGGMVTVPALMFLAHMDVKMAVATSLWFVAGVSLTAAIHQRFWQHLRPRLLATFAISGMIGGAMGSQVGLLLPSFVQVGMLALLTFYVAWWTSRVRLKDRVSVFRFIPAAFAGLVIGILTGALGVGGGFLLVPALIYLGVERFQLAVVHSLVLIFLNATVAAISYIPSMQIPVHLTVGIAALAAVGSIIGGILLKRLPGDALKKGFAVLLVLLGGLMLWQAWRM